MTTATEKNKPRVGDLVWFNSGSSEDGRTIGIVTDVGTEEEFVRNSDWYKLEGTNESLRGMGDTVLELNIKKFQRTVMKISWLSRGRYVPRAESYCDYLMWQYRNKEYTNKYKHAFYALYPRRGTVAQFKIISRANY